MISRQSFFRRIAAVVAAVALAPEIVFGARMAIEIPKPELNLQKMMDDFYDTMRVNHARGYQGDEIVILTDSQGVAACERWISQFHDPDLV